MVVFAYLVFRIERLDEEEEKCFNTAKRIRRRKSIIERKSDETFESTKFWILRNYCGAIYDIR